jgi:YegS/Rv2252/BmrU family lipid kinase
MRAKLILNPTSRRAVSAARLKKIERALTEKGFSLETCAASQPGEAREKAAGAVAESFQMVICAGGDGTIHEVVNGIAGSDLVLGILPMGTGNVLAWEMNIPLDLQKACEVLATGRVRTIDLGLTSVGSYFSCMAGVGLDAQVVKEVYPAVKGFLGVIAYPITAVRTVLRYGLPELTINIDDKGPPLTGHSVVVCNSRRYGGRFVLCPNAAVDDGWLDVCILQEHHASAIIRSGLSMVLNHHEAAEGVAFHRGRSIQVISDRKALVQSDGDIIGTTPISFSIVPKALRVMAPA